MERVLIVNADDFGLSKGQNYGIIEACKMARSPRQRRWLTGRRLAMRLS